MKSVQDEAERFQRAILHAVFQDRQRPQKALARLLPRHPDLPLSQAIFTLTTIATDLRGAFAPDTHWTPEDWLECAASLGCDLHVLETRGILAPNSAARTAFWAGLEGDPHLPDGA
ncbi:MAG: hypothetical protein AAFO93_02695 [Pseudomonadota bacterium]